MRISFLILLLLRIAPAPVIAQGHNVYCDMADSTAATQACLKKHLDGAQRRLNKIFDRLNSDLDSEEKRAQLKDLQKTWLDYRDAECMWEMEQTETASLKRINELSCMARVTDDRADLLTVIVMDQEAEGGAREYGSFPRWMNVLAKDYPAVYWDYGKRFSDDLNCDEEPEQIMMGMTVQKEGDVLSQDIIVAVAQNPATGRPTPKLFTFDVEQEASEKALCSAQIGLTVREEKQAQKESKKDEAAQEVGEETEEEKTCLRYLEIKHSNCKARKIKWDGKAFDLEALPVPDETPEEEKKK